MTAPAVLGLVVSRARHAWIPHAAAVLAVALLMASFVTFSALGAGMEHALSRRIAEEDLHHVRLPAGNEPMDADDLARVSAIPGVSDVRPKGVATTDLRIGSGPLLLVGVDAKAEADRVVAEPAREDLPEGMPVVGIGGEKYLLLGGRWIGSPDEAVLALNGVDGKEAIGRTIEVGTSAGARGFHVVGVVHLLNPANVRGQIQVAGGHVIVDLAAHPFDAYGAFDVVTEPEYDVLMGVAAALKREYPEQAYGIQKHTYHLERQYHDARLTAAALGAAATLTGLVGAGTVFGVSLLLLSQEERRLGLMKAVGFRRGHVWLYGVGKLGLVAGAGVVVGGLLALATAQAMPMPPLALTFSPLSSAAVMLEATLRTLGFALAGGGAAVALATAKDAAASLRHSE